VDRVELLEKHMRDLKQVTPVDWEEEVSVGCRWLATEEAGDN
jgi:hypothetical protein